MYLVRCRDGSLYTGISMDVKRRFEEHQENGKKGSKYLRGRGPLVLALKEKIGKKNLAIKIEARVKRFPKIKKELLVERKIKTSEIKKALLKT